MVSKANPEAKGKLSNSVYYALVIATLFTIQHTLTIQTRRAREKVYECPILVPLFLRTGGIPSKGGHALVQLICMVAAAGVALMSTP